MKTQRPLLALPTPARLSQALAGALLCSGLAVAADKPADKPAPAPTPASTLRYVAVRGCNYVTNSGQNKHAERGEEMKDIKASDAKELCELHAALACEPRVIEALHTLSGLPPEDVLIVKAAMGLA